MFKDGLKEVENNYEQEAFTKQDWGQPQAGKAGGVW